MGVNGILEVVVLLLILLGTVKPLGLWIANLYERKPCFLDKGLKPIEFAIYRLCAIDSKQEMTWKTYTASMLIFGFLNILFVYAIQRLQGFLPLDPENFAGVQPDLAFNTAISFTTNTNWQAYSGESSLSYFTQMLGLTVQNFISAATGLSILVAIIRGIRQQENANLGNFWVDLVRGTLYLFIPLSIIFALLFVSQGVIQNFADYQKALLIEKVEYQTLVLDQLGQPIFDTQGKPITSFTELSEQIIPMGPVASQVAIKQLGTNGGGFFNTNSAHPFENPTPFSNFLQVFAIMLIPMALCYTFGVMVQNTRQGWAIFLAMFFIFISMLTVTILTERQNNPALKQALLEGQQFTNAGNIEGKEIRIGSINSAVWATATTATGNGSINAALDSFLPIGGLVPLWLISTGEVVFGGVGSGLYQMLVFVIISVFVSGLMVGRTPEYLGKKIEPFEIKMASLVILIMPFFVLLSTALSVVIQNGIGSTGNSGAHRFTEILYAFSSMTNNNGSALSGLNANSIFYNTLGGIVMLVGRYWIAIPVLAIAGSLSQKKSIPLSVGTLPTDTSLFIIILISIILIFGALTFFPSLCLGPIVEYLMNGKGV